MKKKIVTSLVMTMVTGAACAFAANPFVDVPADSWAYHSVVTLAEAGIIQGVDGTHFEGGRNITRYEAAEIVAKAMAHQDRATVEQRAMINKLADEFSAELNSLGVRVSDLEKKVGNVRLTGDANVHYQHWDKAFKNDASWEYAVHLLATADVNDKTTVNFGLSTDDMSFADEGSASGNKDHHVYADHANVEYRAGNMNFLVGRYDYQIGNGLGLQYSDTFDGAQAQYVGNRFTLTGGYGKFKEGGINNVKTGYVSLDGAFEKFGAGLYYNQFHGESVDEDGTHEAVNADKLYGGYLSFRLGQKLNLIGDYQRVSFKDDTADANLWGAKLQYGEADAAEKGTWDAWVDYVNVDQNGFGGSTGNWRDDDFLGWDGGVRSWGVGFDYTLAKNVMLAAGQTFGSKTKKGDTDPKEYTSVELDFFF
ncbi:MULTISPECIES: S-layer homology domain-containing protein [Megasphaera]|nr:MULTISPECIES: S-layer homology domain-containing protein [Megasphaera]